MEQHKWLILILSTAQIATARQDHARGVARALGAVPRA